MATAISMSPSMSTLAAAYPRWSEFRRLCRRRDVHRTMRRKTPASMRIPASFVSCAPRALQDSSAAAGDEGEGRDSEPYSVLTAVSSCYNDIVVVDTPKARMLLLDSTHNVHSMLNKEQKWTGSYWDDFSSLPAIIPEGPIALLGLLIHMAREYFGLSSLEKCTEAGGLLSVCIGDAISPSALVQGKFAGIIVDLFAGGKILPQLQEVATWVELEKGLMRHGRIMVNCGGSHSEVSGGGVGGDSTSHTNVPLNSPWVQNTTIKMMFRAFSGKLSWKRIKDEDSDNYLALTGPLPDLNAWSAALPSPLSFNVKQWRPCDLA